MSDERVSATFGPNADRALRYVDLLSTVAVERGLIGPREADRIWGRHMFNCAAVAQLVPDAADVIDLGSGAGLPGIPVVLARPDVRMVLLEPMGRRADFLSECLAVLDLPGVTVHHGRAQDGVPRRANVVLARAVAPLPELAAMARPLVIDGGVLLAIKGAKAAAEIAGLEAAGEASGMLHELIDAAGETATVVEVHWSRMQGSGKQGRKST